MWTTCQSSSDDCGSSTRSTRSTTRLATPLAANFSFQHSSHQAAHIGPSKKINSCLRFRPLSYLTLAEAVKHWSMTTLRNRLVETGTKVVRHGRSVIFQMRRLSCRACCSRPSPPLALRPLPSADVEDATRAAGAFVGATTRTQTRGSDRQMRHLALCCAANEERMGHDRRDPCQKTWARLASVP